MLRATDDGSGVDAVRSIEMGEHVGEQLYPAYVASSSTRALRPGGKLLLQQMSRRADAAPGGGAFIESYIAPDMHMRPLWQTLRYLQDGGFEILSVASRCASITSRTAERCIDDAGRSALMSSLRCRADEVARVWQLYLAGGMLAFEEGRMGVDRSWPRKRPAAYAVRAAWRTARRPAPH